MVIYFQLRFEVSWGNDTEDGHIAQRRLDDPPCSRHARSVSPEVRVDQGTVCSPNSVVDRWRLCLPAPSRHNLDQSAFVLATTLKPFNKFLKSYLQSHIVSAFNLLCRKVIEFILNMSLQSNIMQYGRPPTALELLRQRIKHSWI